MGTLGKDCRVFLIHQIDCIGGTRVKASEWHVTSSRADMSFWFISRCCIWKQASNHSLDGGVGNMPVHHGTIDGCRKWGNNSRQGFILLVWGCYQSRFKQGGVLPYLSQWSLRRLCSGAQRTLWPHWTCILFPAGEITAWNSKHCS